MNKTLFISDLHLTESRPDISKAFFDFLDNQVTSELDALYILGDFFEVWVGDDYQTDLTLKIAQELNAITNKGIPVYFIHGNRDFLVSKKYAELSGISILNERTVIDLYGTPTLILHGDEMCTQDIEYQKFRKKSRGWWWPKLMLAMPLFYRQSVAKKARERSKASQMDKAPEVLDVTHDAVIDTFKKFQTHLMIHGHTHRPKVHEHDIDGTPAKRIVLGDWYTQGSYLVVTKDAQELIFTDFE
ncbi:MULTISPECIES: UDP-2,3-diacylglucosamine diphosphatase [unclassified Pseudoalteromonas]|jgi:UDP-2,3-diacylglucosamine hydrolase|uniref:UDP-2,3-diacylglucosamine diphosphatase n=1 Tax=unclassified Pseudoalteromonas TaxID=194690 RepID=UPI0005A67F91|nr:MULTISPECIES: UDP-2,3-diacylglucosamine diphosphatase [unclassified Pseudoalteromonas]